jgi:hypothetical protein
VFLLYHGQGREERAFCLGATCETGEAGDAGFSFFSLSLLNFELDAGFFVEMKEENCQICLHT